MTSIAATRSTVRDRIAPTAPIFPMLTAQTRAQFRAFWRLPSVSATALLMPLMLFVFFVLPHAHEPMAGQVTVGAYMLAAIGAYAAGSVMVFNFGVTVALDRGQKVDLLMRAAPLPGSGYLASRIIAALLFAVLAVAALFAIAIVAGGIRLDVLVWLDLAGRLVAGAIPFLLLGFAIAYLAGPGAAPAVANLLFIGMAFASGMLVPLDQMPGFLREVAPLLPTYHYAQFAWNALGVGEESVWVSGAWLMAYTAALFGLAAFAYRREGRRRFA
ncbi:MAG: ABC transporter permease [Candidatus Limnocylindrales bacterium]